MILGVDGGGTKTIFLLTDIKGRRIATYQTEGLHYIQIGFEGFQERLCQGIQEIITRARIKIEEVQHLVIGVPGFGESKEHEETLREILAQSIQCKYTPVNDVKLAWAGSLACNPGVCVLAGTGSMAYAVDDEYKDIRCGGWGHIIGDEGSAFWLGQKASEIFCKMSDGRYKKGPLYSLVKEKLNLTHDFNIINYVFDSGNLRNQIADLAILLHEAVIQGDPYAVECFSNAAEELSLLLRGILNSYVHKDPTRPISVSYLGGVFNSHTLFLDKFETYIQSYPVRLKAPMLTSAEGACLYGAKMLCHTQNISLHTHTFIEELKNE